jgi:hypothetical protein
MDRPLNIAFFDPSRLVCNVKTVQHEPLGGA